MNNSRFIFSGSSVHMLSSMFMQYNQPFYNSSAVFGLKPVSKESYQTFCEKMFSLYGKAIDPEAVSFAYDLLWGNIQNLQRIMRTSFSFIRKGECVDIDIIKESVSDILDSGNESYVSALARSGEKRNRRILGCVAAEGVAKGLTSSAMISKYGLGASSSVQDALAQLGSPKNSYLVRAENGSYYLYDKFFELWIARRLGILELKYKTASDLFEAYKKSKEVKIPVKKSSLKF